MDLRQNTVRTATAVLESLRNGAPITDSARESMPTLIRFLTDLGEKALADDIAAAFQAYAESEA